MAKNASKDILTDNSLIFKFILEKIRFAVYNIGICDKGEDND